MGFLTLVSAADVLRHRLISLGHGTLPTDEGAWPIHVGFERDTPDNMITIYHTEGEKDFRSQNTGRVFELYGAQIRIRAIDEVTGRKRLGDITKSIDETIYGDTVLVGSDTYRLHFVSRTSGPFSLGKESESSKRHIHVLNVLINVEPLQV